MRHYGYFATPPPVASFLPLFRAIITPLIFACLSYQPLLFSDLRLSLFMLPRYFAADAASADEPADFSFIYRHYSFRYATPADFISMPPIFTGFARHDILRLPPCCRRSWLFSPPAAFAAFRRCRQPPLDFARFSFSGISFRRYFFQAITPFFRDDTPYFIMAFTVARLAAASFDVSFSVSPADAAAASFCHIS